MSTFDITAMSDPVWIGAFLKAHWHDDFLVSRGKRTEARELDGAVARKDSEIVGLITWRCDGDEMEITSLDSLETGVGVGTWLLEHAFAQARAAGLRRVWLTTTNDNIEALKFYQKRGLQLCALYPNAVEWSRRQKPDIPEIGHFGIPIRDEVELECVLPCTKADP